MPATLKLPLKHISALTFTPCLDRIRNSYSKIHNHSKRTIVIWASLYFLCSVQQLFYCYRVLSFEVQDIKYAIKYLYSAGTSSSQLTMCVTLLLYLSHYTKNLRGSTYEKLIARQVGISTQVMQAETISELEHFPYCQAASFCFKNMAAICSVWQRHSYLGVTISDPPDPPM